MELNDLAGNVGEWLRGSGPESDIVISSRIRLARNLAEFPFISRTSESDKKEIEKQLAEESKRTGAGPDSTGEDIDHKLEEGLSELESRIQRLGDRLEEAQRGRTEADTRYNDVCRILFYCWRFGAI